jgi:hypothetical protein
MSEIIFNEYEKIEAVIRRMTETDKKKLKQAFESWIIFDIPPDESIFKESK